jgi:hypothetical protein
MPWPKGRSRKPQVKLEDVSNVVDKPKEKGGKPKWTEKAGSNWDFAERIKNAAKGVSWSDTSEENRLAIDPEILERLKQQGIALQWCTKTVFGQPQEHHMSHFRRGGWTEVEPGEIEGVDVVEIDGVVLMARPLSIHQKALKHNHATAAQPWESRKQFLTEGVPLVSGAGRHPSAVKSNRLNRTLERVDIPTDER